MKFSSKKTLVYLAGSFIIILVLTGYTLILNKYNHTYTEDSATAQAADPFSCSMTKTPLSPQNTPSDKISNSKDGEKNTLLNEAHITLCTFLY